MKPFLFFFTIGMLIGFVGCSTPSTPQVEAPAIISRAEWKAVPPNLNATNETGLYDQQTNPGGWKVYAEPLAKVLRTVVIHHSALPPTEGPLQIQRLHMRERGYADIGYHFLIDPEGRIYEGRSLSVRGAHTAEHNTGTVGIVLLGNFDESRPAEKQLESAKTLLRYLVSKYKITHLAGHRDFVLGKTTCPGRYVEDIVWEWAGELDLTFGTAGYAHPNQPAKTVK